MTLSLGIPGTKNTEQKQKSLDGREQVNVQEGSEYKKKGWRDGSMVTPPHQELELQAVVRFTISMSFTVGEGL